MSLWIIPSLLLNIVFAQRSYYIDARCPFDVQSAINEAIYDLLPTAVYMKGEPKFEAILDYIYPGMTLSRKQPLFCMFTIFLLYRYLLN